MSLQLCLSGPNIYYKNVSMLMKLLSKKIVEHLYFIRCNFYHSFFFWSNNFYHSKPNQNFKQHTKAFSKWPKFQYRNLTVDGSYACEDKMLRVCIGNFIFFQWVCIGSDGFFLFFFLGQTFLSLGLGFCNRATESWDLGLSLWALQYCWEACGFWTCAFYI